MNNNFEKFDFSVENKVVAITGSCGTLGNSYVEAFVQNNAIPLMIDRPQQKPIERAQALGLKLSVPFFNNIQEMNKIKLKRKLLGS